MKILFLHTYGNPHAGGGAELTLWTLLRGLRDAGHECVLLAISDQPGLTRTEREGIAVWEAGIRNVYFPTHSRRPGVMSRIFFHLLDSYNPLMQGYLRDVVEKEKPDIVSCHDLPGWSAASWHALAGLGLPAVQVLHCYYSACVKTTMYKNGANCSTQCASCRAFRLPHRSLSQNLDAVVGVSRYVLEKHTQLGYFKNVPHKRVIYNARSPEMLDITGASTKHEHEELRVGYIGRLDAPKGIELLVEAFLSLNNHHSQLLIAGSGKSDYETELRSSVADARVKFMGRMAPNEFHQHVDVVVIPSLWNEPLGMVVAEALAFGNPVIGAQRGGIPEMIEHGVNGLLFDPDVPGELECCLRRYQDEPELRSRLASNARPSSSSFTDMKRFVTEYESLYSEVIAHTKKQRVSG